MIFALLLLVVLCAFAYAEAAVPPIKVGEDGVLRAGGKPYRAFGVNYFDAFVRTLHDPQDTSYRAGFAELHKRGIPFVRFAACGFWPVEMKQYETDRASYLARLDKLVAAAEEYHIGLIPSLFWHLPCVPDLVGEPCSAWGKPGSKTLAFMERYTRDLVKRYRNSPALWAWEFGNEYMLAADLPNASEHRPWVHPALGTASSRSAADDMTSEAIEFAYRRFAETVRALDPLRPITSGDSIPRSSAWHQRTELSWQADTRAQFMQFLQLSTPPPMDLVEVHIYPGKTKPRFGETKLDVAELLALCTKAAKARHQAVFVGEFGLKPDDEGASEGEHKQRFKAFVDTLAQSEVALAALWNFDYKDPRREYNVPIPGPDSWPLDVLAEANERLAGASGPSE